MSNHHNDDQLVFADQADNSDDSQSIIIPWVILIVDDEEEVHSVTRLVLSGVILDGRPLAYLHAYSAAEALEILSQRDDIALTLLDVVMETDDAGLRAVKAIREDLNNDEIRIVLRTGQPGQAPEERVIMEYDINDYKTKTELTRSKLLTTVVSALRSYQQIRTINESRRGLEKIVNAAANLMERHSINNFSEGVVTQLASLLGLEPEGLLCVKAPTATQNDVIVLGAAGHFADAIQQPIEYIKERRIVDGVRRCLEQKKHLYLPNATVFYIDAKGIEAAAYIESSEVLRQVDHKLIEIFLANIAIGFENVSLFEELRTAAYRDQLTGLANRAEFISLLEKSLLSSEPWLFAISDISHFSDVNDALGQDIGNELIYEVGKRLRTHFPEPAVVARISADVFGLICKKDDLTPGVMQNALVEPFVVSEHRIPISMTTGFSLQHSANDGLDVLKQAYIALKNAKNHRLDSYAFYHPSMEAETQRRLDLIRRLRSDFHAEVLQLWYQPQVELRSGRLVGVEALLRWPQEDGSFISPEVFIPLAEYSGLILDVGAWVLEEACRSMESILEDVDPDFRMAVNVSVPQFRQRNFANMVGDIMARYNIPRGRLELEITESIVMDDPKLVAEVLHQLKSKGVRVAIDDFGVGFSSLSYVQQLPLDKLKIDRAFVKAAHTNSGAVIIETIVNMGHRLGLSTLAEGIETEEQARYFEELRVTEAQGYLYARPMPLQDLRHHINKSSARS
ncbi:diguanylate phosphodiesterase [Aliidiomarina minuta]|uniref:Diguanylate phosphodiesterase n=1 Tax=Aliidiomarina minuta TaxID=880057 RepID=A0A432W473_9GAMM|nr:EAL domain-containing protein [Aliidiomarina minuta]RUO24269.1 diguanylate phosphodiesterase [Aliidiomarina minuta]